MRISVGQFEPVQEFESNLRHVKRCAEQAAEQSARLLVLPELSLSGWGTPSEVAAMAQPLDGYSVGKLAAVADKFDLAIVSGLYERRQESERPYNTLVAVAPGRGLVATHRKTHLFDAWGYKESDEVGAGDGALDMFTVGDGVTVGLINCYEVRFPERAYALALAGVDLISVSAAWPRGPHREDHWTLNLRARAVENTIWVAGASALGADVIGRSTIVDPLGVLRCQLTEDPAVAVVDLDLDRTTKARAALPVLQQRRERYACPVTATATATATGEKYN